MKKLQFYLKPFLLSGIFLLILACGGDDDDPGPGPDPGPEPRTIQDVIDDFNNLTINVGTNDLQLETLVEGEFWSFRIIVPEGASSSNLRPMVLRLHGAAQSGSASAHQSTSCLVEPAFAGKDVFILSPNSRGLLWSERPNIDQILLLHDLMLNRFDIDTDRIVTTGYSDGGNGSWFYAQYAENLMTAAIPMATSYFVKDGNDQVVKINVPLYVIHGSEDALFPVELTEAYVNEHIEAGTDARFVVADGLVHNDPCAYEAELKNAVDWLYTNVW